MSAACLHQTVVSSANGDEMILSLPRCKKIMNMLTNVYSSNVNHSDVLEVEIGINEVVTNNPLSLRKFALWTLLVRN